VSNGRLSDSEAVVHVLEQVDKWLAARMKAIASQIDETKIALHASRRLGDAQEIEDLANVMAGLIQSESATRTASQLIETMIEGLKPTSRG